MSSPADSPRSRRNRRSGRLGVIVSESIRPTWNNGRLAGEPFVILPGWASPPVLDQTTRVRQSLAPINQEEFPNVRMGKMVPRELR